MSGGPTEKEMKILKKDTYILGCCWFIKIRFFD